jgi:hypothetical protein
MFHHFEWNKTYRNRSKILFKEAVDNFSDGRQYPIHVLEILQVTSNVKSVKEIDFRIHMKCNRVLNEKTKPTNCSH